MQKFLALLVAISCCSIVLASEPGLTIFRTTGTRISISDLQALAPLSTEEFIAKLDEKYGLHVFVLASVQGSERERIRSNLNQEEASYFERMTVPETYHTNVEAFFLPAYSNGPKVSDTEGKVLNRPRWDKPAIIAYNNASKGVLFHEFLHFLIDKGRDEKPVDVAGQKIAAKDWYDQKPLEIAKEIEVLGKKTRTAETEKQLSSLELDYLEYVFHAYLRPTNEEVDILTFTIAHADALNLPKAQTKKEFLYLGDRLQFGLEKISDISKAIRYMDGKLATLQLGELQKRCVSFSEKVSAYKRFYDSEYERWQAKRN
ncbi:MAG: hypothetical protein HY537_00555 [Deltaproteobacteria bacterium]|nr:hypothetical protein [Deltaproteobacteria bacterium]